jgi:glycerol-3-phosphate dehydrogenase
MNGKAVGVQVMDTLSGRMMEVRAKSIVFTVGPWTDELLQRSSHQLAPTLRNTKGVHIIYPGQFSRHGLFLPLPEENRVMFMIPWHGNTLIGTTDTDYKSDPDKVAVSEADIDYLLSRAQRFFPEASFEVSKIVHAFAGLRPLPQREGRPSEITRKPVIKQHYTGVYYVIGGKYTTYRAIAEQALRLIVPQHNLRIPDVVPLRGAGDGQIGDHDRERWDLTEEDCAWLSTHYGSQVDKVFEVMEREPHLNKKLCSCTPAREAEVRYHLESEMAVTDQDIIDRRLGLNNYPCTGLECRKRIATMVKEFHNGRE